MCTDGQSGTTLLELWFRPFLGDVWLKLGAALEPV